MNTKFVKLFLLVWIMVPVFNFYAMQEKRDFDVYEINSTEEDISKKLDSYMQTLTKLNRFSGSVLVAKDDKIFLNKGYGFANHEFEIFNIPQTKFRICSITKMVTAVAIMQLQERGMLNIEKYLDQYFSDFPRGNEITIHQLLTHTSGVSSINLPLEMVVFPTTLEKLCSFFKNQQLEFEPGLDYQYSNAGYYLLSYVIEKVSGKSYESFIKENILVPLNMNDSFFLDHDYAILKNSASGYCFNETNTVVNGHFVYENSRGCGGLFCTAYDLYIFAQALLKGKVINDESLKAMFTPYNSKENYGYGCNIQNFMGHKFVEHGGLLSSGFKTNLSIFVEDELYIIILSNLFSSWVYEARDALAAIIFDQPYELPSNNPIVIDSALYDDYAGTYDNPCFKDGYEIKTNGYALYLPDGKELIPVEQDQFMALNCCADNIVYRFIRDEKGQINWLVIQGGGQYFKVCCEKIK